MPAGREWTTTASPGTTLALMLLSGAGLSWSTMHVSHDDKVLCTINDSYTH